MLNSYKFFSRSGSRKGRMRMRSRQRRIALERIDILFSFAQKMYRDSPELSHRYVDLARRIAMRTRTKMPREYRMRFCRKCKSFLVPGVNCRHRIRQRREPHVAVTCFECGYIGRRPIGGRGG
jgi:ribonuclease P protein subunit RPR2